MRTMSLSCFVRHEPPPRILGARWVLGFRTFRALSYCIASRPQSTFLGCTVIERCFWWGGFCADLWAGLCRMYWLVYWQ